MFKKFLTQLVVTFFLIGKIKYAPGTFGSIAAFPFIYMIIIKNKVLTYLILNRFAEHSDLLFRHLIDGYMLILCLIILLFLIGWIFSSTYIKYYSITHDPKEIVIDEVVGQMLTTFGCFIGSIALNYFFPILAIRIDAILNKFNNLAYTNILVGFIFLTSFLLFRFFDIIKPWPISWIDKNVKGGFGVMIDDVLAAIFAIFSYNMLLFILTFFIS